jgi:putative PIG3 family NAD(P)H quinone oxidoreductase
MRAVVMSGTGGPEVLEVREVDTPEPGEGEVRVRVSRSGLNRADLSQRRGRYPAPPGWPADILGLEFCGTIDALGEEVEEWALGDRVMGIVGGGGYGEYLVTHHRTLIPIPESLDDDGAGAVPEVFLTAYDAMILQCRLAPGETVLIHAAGSGVGTAAVQLATWVGATSVGTSRTPGKLDRARQLGLDHGVLAGGAGGGGGEGDDDGGSDWVGGVLAATGGRGADVILDLVGGAYLAGNQRVVASGGRHVVVGVPSGPRAELDLRLLMGKRASIRGTVLRARPLEEKIELADAFIRDILPALSAGRVAPVVDRILPAESVAEAHSYLESNESFGKVLLSW